MDLRAAGVGASGDYRRYASCVEQADQEQRYPGVVTEANGSEEVPCALCIRIVTRKPLQAFSG
jgi:hypothetical protein